MAQQPEIQTATDPQQAQNTGILANQTAPEPSQVEHSEHTTHRRWSRIQRLPAKVRLSINQALRDGQTYDEILKQLATGGHVHITYDNVATWFKTGYADWLRDQEHFEKLVLTTDATRKTKPSRKNRKNFRILSELDLAVQLHTAARKFNLEKFCEHLDGKPEIFLRLVHANALHERNAILRDRNAIELKKIKNKKPAKRAEPKRGGITLEELERIDERMRL